METVIGIFFTSLGIGFTGAVMPGPLLAITLKESLSHGKWSALWLSTGHALCELIMVAALALGLSRLVSGESITGPVGLLGGAILVWMGISALRQPAKTTAADVSTSPPQKVHKLLLHGSAVTVTNPYWTIWWLTVGVGLVLISAKLGPLGIISFYIGHILSDYLWFGGVGLAVGSGSRFLEGRPYRLAIKACGIFLLLFGAFFIRYGARIVRPDLIR